MIRAEIHADDFQETAKFDATPFFEAAQDREILDLAEAGWGGDYAADAVAQGVGEREGYAEVEAVFEHCRQNRGTGFECHVHASDAFAWVKENRPALLEGLREAMGLEAGEDYAVAGQPSWDRDSSWTGDYAVPVAPSP